MPTAATKRRSYKKPKHNTTMKSYYGQHDTTTFHGVSHWYKHLFEKLGWMILAKNHGYVDKIVAYKTSIQRLRQAIEHKLKTSHDHDRKEDLRIMHTNLIILEKHAEEDFKM